VGGDGLDCVGGTLTGEGILLAEKLGLQHIKDSGREVS
jgi:hypothetical protein